MGMGNGEMRMANGWHKREAGEWGKLKGRLTDIQCDEVVLQLGLVHRPVRFEQPLHVLLNGRRHKYRRRLHLVQAPRGHVHRQPSLERQQPENYDLSSSMLHSQNRRGRRKERQIAGGITIWSMWPWEMNRYSCETARCGHRPMSKAILSVGKITQVSCPPIDSPSTGYPSTSKPFPPFFFPPSAAMAQRDSDFSETRSCRRLRRSRRRPSHRVKTRVNDDAFNSAGLTRSARRVDSGWPALPRGFQLGVR